jgi:putative (di)nucleoside polyphosphate hydrolase
MSEEIEYRPNVSAVILSSKYPEKCEFFIAHRSDIKDAWQFPQGGIDKGESPQDALIRELQEEIGYSDVEIIAEFPEWISYEFPNVISKKMYPFKGQRQKYFLVRLKEDSSIDLHAHEFPEFEEYEFVSYEDLFRRVTYFKRRIYRQVIEHFTKEGFI